jgi:hypothetical protein
VARGVPAVKVRKNSVKITGHQEGPVARNKQVGGKDSRVKSLSIPSLPTASLPTLPRKIPTQFFLQQWEMLAWSFFFGDAH